MPTVRQIIDHWPRLQRPAHFVYSLLLKLKNFIIRPLVDYGGHLPRSLSDRGQDTWVLEIFERKRGGFFLDIGGADGFSESNTYILERVYDWAGICVEPNPSLFALLSARRKCTCVQEIIDQNEAEVEFVLSGQESRLLGKTINRGFVLRKGEIIRLRAMTLESLLMRYRAPDTIDYFSLDVEGAETSILKPFPFNKYKFLSMTIERPSPELNALLFKEGYVFVRNSLYDSFYVHETIPNFSRIPRQPFEQLPAKGF